jgi:hypothetical protein
MSGFPITSLEAMDEVNHGFYKNLVLATKQSHPAKIDTIDFAGKLCAVTDSLSRMQVNFGDKLHVPMDAFVSLAHFSAIDKAAAAQILPRGSGRNQQSEEPDYPAAFGATRVDMISSGLRTHFLPPDGTHLTSTGVNFDPARDDIAAAFRTVWMTPPQLVNKAQSVMLQHLRAHFDDSIFPTLNKTFYASDLLQKLWQYLFGRVQRNRSTILQYAEKWFLTSLATADDFHAALLQFKAIQTCKNILEHKPPMETNPNFVIQLLQGLRRNVNSVPPEIRPDFNSVVDDLLRAAVTPNVVLHP